MHTNKKIYSVVLNWKNWQKRCHFEGIDNIQVENDFNLLCENLNTIGDNAKNSRDFFKNAEDYFIENGFKPITL